MRRIVIIGLVLGFAGTLSAAHYVPWVDPQRLPSQTTVVANGGRAERFVIHLPADRLNATGAETATLRGAAPPASFEAAGGTLPLLEHFKIRDGTGNVIGVAARHWSPLPDGPQTAWIIAVPSRGALLLSGPGEGVGALEAALAARGRRPGSAWSGELGFVVADDSPVASDVSGSREFAGLDVRYTERWNVTGIGEDGQLRGTIELDTLSRRRP